MRVKNHIRKIPKSYKLKKEIYPSKLKNFYFQLRLKQFFIPLSRVNFYPKEGGSAPALHTTLPSKVKTHLDKKAFLCYFETGLLSHLS